MSSASIHHQHSKPAHPLHVVQFYEDDTFLVESVARFLDPILNVQDSALVIASQAHRDAVVEELKARGVDMDAAIQSGRFVALDAAEVLAQFVVEGWPDESRFQEVIGPIVERARISCEGERGLGVFGEMVALLWADEKREAAVRLEQLWNGLLQSTSFSLFCAYPMSSFASPEHRTMFFNICGEHSEVNPTEGYPAQGSESRRRRSVAKLQQKTRALENEIRLSQERILLLQHAAGIGTWEMDVLDETISFSSQAARMLGVDAGCLPLSQFLGVVHYSGDRDRLLAAMKRARTGRKEFVTEFRLDVGSETRVFSIRGKTLYNNGQPLVLGVLADVTPTSSTPAS